MNTTVMENISVADELEQLDAMEKRKQAALAKLLSEVLHYDGHVFVQKTRMGDSDSYVGSVSFRWVDKNVRLFTRLPMLRDKIDPETGQFIIDEGSVEELQQRAPHWDRQYVLTSYLLRQRHRKFPPILVVVMEKWVTDRTAPEWDRDGRAIRTSMPIRFLDPEGQLGLVDFRQGVTMFAIDGSHRTIAINGLMEARNKGVLPIRNTAGKEVGVKPLDELLEEAGLTEFHIEGIEDEKIGIEFVPAVMKGETAQEARIRIRSTFVHVNKTAVPPTLGEQIVLDEDNGFAIVTRRVGLSHQLFKFKRGGDRINWKSTSLPAGGIWLTPAVHLTNMVEGYLGVKSPYASWVAKRREIPLRPTDEQLEAGQAEFSEFLDKLATLPSFQAVLSGEKIDAWREFPDKGGRGHLLMRPLGQLALANAVGYLHNDPDPDGPKMSLTEIFDKLKRYDKAGGFEGVNEAKSVWFGVTYNPQRGTMSMRDQGTATELLEYLLGGLTAEEEQDLLEKFRDLRTIEVSQDEVHAWDYDGKDVGDREAIQLPPQIKSE